MGSVLPGRFRLPARSGGPPGPSWPRPERPDEDTLSFLYLYATCMPGSGLTPEEVMLDKYRRVLEAICRGLYLVRTV
ncbi:hypothetical protein hamaS1_16700 [Moorella sp. Hama-1]|nr:hypothetical protein hamaS1_16700 [Moorella sp. Hama-1]